MMNNFIFLIKLTENDKRILISIAIIFILILVLIGLLVELVRKVMKRQGKVVDTFMYDLVRYKVVKTTKHFKKVANKKSFRYFYKKTKIPFLLMIVASLVVFIFCLITKQTDINFLFSYEKGFNSLFYIFDWKNIPKNNFFGLTIPCDWPEIINKPHFLYNDVHAWISYITVPLFIIGALWFMFNVQAFIARKIRIIKMSKDVFSKDLDKLVTNNDI